MKRNLNPFCSVNDKNKKSVCFKCETDGLMCYCRFCVLLWLEYVYFDIRAEGITTYFDFFASLSAVSIAFAAGTAMSGIVPWMLFSSARNTVCEHIAEADVHATGLFADDCSHATFLERPSK